MDGIAQQGPTPTVRGEAACPAVSSAWATTAAATWEGRGQGAKPRGRGEARQETAEGCRTAHPASLVDPDAQARSKVKRFAEALKALGDVQGPEAEFLQDAMKRAPQASQERPLARQMCECRMFIDRSERRLQKMDAQREAMDAQREAQLEEGRSRLARLQAQAVVLPPNVSMNTPSENLGVRI